MSGTEALNSDDMVDAGEIHHKAGRLQEAESYYRKALEIDPGHPGALYFLATIAYEDGRTEVAAQLIEDLLREEPRDAEAWHLLGLIALGADPVKAVECFRQSLSIEPAFVQTHYALGTAFARQNEVENAISSFRQALDLSPAFAEAHCAIANIYKTQSNFVDALSSYRKALEARPSLILAYESVGEILLSQGEVDEAIKNFHAAIDADVRTGAIYIGLGNAHISKSQFAVAEINFKEAIALLPQSSAAHFNLGIALIKQGNIRDAAKFFELAADLDPQNTRPLENLVEALKSLGEIEKAAEVYRRWLALEPDNPVPRHHLAACTQSVIPARAEDAYVEHTFDEFADSFDAVLGDLNYRAPQLLAQVLRRKCGSERKQFVLLDAGCGTGLCGPLIAGYASRLVGVDLSAGMLEKAKLRGVYDELLKAELTAYLQSQSSVFDIIFSADTFNYFGELTSLFSAAHKAMKKDGLLFFTLEVHEDSGFSSETGYHLSPHGRYSHTEAYIQHSLLEAGFNVLSREIGVLRSENKEAVQGYLMCCRAA